MRKLSSKWPVRLTVFSFLPPIFYSFRKPEIFSSTEFAQKVLGGVFIAIIIWVVYGIISFFAQTRVNCGSCKFSDVVQDSKEMKCRLTGYNYPITYSCKKSHPKEIEGQK